MTRRLRLNWACLGIGLLVWACAPHKDGHSTRTPTARAGHGAKSDVDDGAFAHLPAGSVGPYLSRSGDGATAVWAEPDTEGTLAWVSVRLDEHGLPVAEPRTLGLAPEGLDLVRVRNASGATWVLGTSSVEGVDAVTALKLDPSGKLVASPLQIAEDAGAVLWADVVPLADGGALVFWAERVAEVAKLFVRQVTHLATSETPARLVYEAARAWQVVAVQSGALLGVVSRAGAIDLVPVDGQGQAAPVARLQDTLHAQGELDLLAIEPTRVLVAFSDEQHLEPQVFTTFVNERGATLTPIRAAVPPRGPQTLRQLAGNAQAQYLVWQDVRESPQQVNATALSSEGLGLLPGISFEVPDSKAAPEFAGSESRFAALLPACELDLCPEQATLVSLTHDLRKVSATPWGIGDAAVQAGWDLHCTGATCDGLGAVFAEESPVAWLGDSDPEEDVSKAQGALWQPTPHTQVQALLTTPELASLAAKSDGSGTTIAWLSYFDPTIPYTRPKTLAPDGRLAPVQAELRTQFIPNNISAGDFRNLPASETISIRARSLAGVALARNETRQLLVWSAIDNGIPQVFTTELDATGHRLRQGMLTRQKGEVVMVRATATANGWAIAWIDERRGSADAYIALIGASLERLTPDTRVELENVHPTALDVVTTGNEIWLALTSVDSKAAGLYARAFDARTLAERTESRSFLPAADATFYNPRMALLDAQPVAAWLAAETQGSSVQSVRFAKDAKTAARPEKRTLDGDLGTLDLACSTTCGAVFTQQSEASLTVASLRLGDNESVQPDTLSHVITAKAAGVAPVQTGNSTYYFDVSQEGTSAVHRVRDMLP